MKMGGLDQRIETFESCKYKTKFRLGPIDNRKTTDYKCIMFKRGIYEFDF